MVACGGAIGNATSARRSVCAVPQCSRIATRGASVSRVNSAERGAALAPLADRVFVRRPLQFWLSHLSAALPPHCHTATRADIDVERRQPPLVNSRHRRRDRAPAYRRGAAPTRRRRVVRGSGVATTQPQLLRSPAGGVLDLTRRSVAGRRIATRAALAVRAPVRVDVLDALPTY